MHYGIFIPPCFPVCVCMPICIPVHASVCACTYACPRASTCVCIGFDERYHAVCWVVYRCQNIILVLHSGNILGSKAIDR